MELMDGGFVYRDIVDEEKLAIDQTCRYEGK